MNETSKKQSYDDIKSDGPDDSAFNTMDRHSKYLNDPAREARMREMGEWADAVGAITEKQHQLFVEAGKAVLEADGTAEEIQLDQKRSSESTKWGVNITDSRGANSRLKFKEDGAVEKTEYANLSDTNHRVDRVKILRSPTHVGESIPVTTESNAA
jgi:hypothetical protein